MVRAPFDRNALNTVDLDNAAQISAACAQVTVWRRVSAFVLDVCFGYGPAFLGFYIAFLSYDDELKRELVPSAAAEMLGAIVGYLFIARLLLEVWKRRQAPTHTGGEPSGGGADSIWMWVLGIAEMLSRLIGRPLEAALAFALFLILKQVDLRSSGEETLLLLQGFNLVLFVLPWCLGFRQVWEGNGQTLGRSVFGLQVRVTDGEPAGFVRMLLRDSVARPFGWLSVYTAAALVLMLEVYTFWIVVPIILLRRSRLSLLLQPYVILWRALAGGGKSGTLPDLVLNTFTTGTT